MLSDKGCRVVVFLLGANLVCCARPVGIWKPPLSFLLDITGDEGTEGGRGMLEGCVGGLRDVGARWEETTSFLRSAVGEAGAETVDVRMVTTGLSTLATTGAGTKRPCVAG